MFIRKYWLPLTVFIVVVAGVGLYLLATQPPKEPIVIYKAVEPLPKSEAKTPVGETSQGGDFHEDGMSKPEVPHDAPVEVSAEVRTASRSAEQIKRDAEFKARMDKLSADMAAAKSARERNAAHLRLLDAFPQDFRQINEPMYNFLKEHPDFDRATATPEVYQKWVDAVYAVSANGHAHAEEWNAEHQRWLKNRDMRPFIIPPKRIPPNQRGNQ